MANHETTLPSRRVTKAKPKKRNGREPLSPAECRRLKWIAKELTRGGVSVQQREIEVACRDFQTGLLPFCKKYGQSLDYILGNKRWKEQSVVWIAYNTRASHRKQLSLP